MVFRLRLKSWYEDMSAVDDLSYLSTIRSCANSRQLSQGIHALLVEG